MSRTTQHDAHTLHHDLHAAQKALNESSARVTALAQEKAGLKAAEVRPCCGAVIEWVSLHVDSARHIPSDKHTRTVATLWGCTMLLCDRVPVSMSGWGAGVLD